ncbi:MAG: hypothetical protein U0840_09580 [Gemmataceae bacterium]
MVSDQLATRRGDYVYVADVVGQRLLVLIYQKKGPSVRLARPYYGERSGSREQWGGLRSETEYQLVYSNNTPLSLENGATVDDAVAANRTSAAVDRHLAMMASQSETEGMERVAGVTLFVYHALPFGAFWDNLARGEGKEAMISLAGDLAMAAIPASGAVKSVWAARGLRIGAGATEAGIGVYRGRQAYLAYQAGKQEEAAGYLGEAFLRLAGVSWSAVSALRARKAGLLSTEVAPGGMRQATYGTGANFPGTLNQPFTGSFADLTAEIQKVSPGFKGFVENATIPGGAPARFNPVTNQIEFGMGINKTTKGLVAEEVRHALDVAEGFNVSAVVAAFKTETGLEAVNNITKFQAWHHRRVYTRMLQDADRAHPIMGKIVGKGDVDSIYELYQLEGFGRSPKDWLLQQNFPNHYHAK